MANNKSSADTLFREYAHAFLCNEHDGTNSRSLAVLYKMAGKPEETQHGTREEQLAYLRPFLPKSTIKKIDMVESVMGQLYGIDTDCDDMDQINSTINGLHSMIPLFKTNNIQDLKTRTQLHQYVYDLYEIAYPENRNIRFAELKNMVKDIRTNDGSFDHNPLNIAAKRIDYFMKKVPARQRYSLLLDIKKKTKDSNRYNYDELLKKVKHEYDMEVYLLNLERAENNQERYEQIKGKELPEAQDNKAKIQLYEEMLTLVNDQDWVRTRKFNEKKSICGHLAALYQAEGMYDKAKKANAEREKFANVIQMTREMAKKKGYPTH